MFSRKRITFEGIMRAKSQKKTSKKHNHEVFKAILQDKDKPKPREIAQKNEFDIISILQEKDMQNIRKNDLGEPTGRREVELLNQWLDQMLNRYVFAKDNIRSDPDKRKEALYHAKLILSICLRDLIRQVSVQCIERGVLIEKVLNNYINIFETETRGNMYDLDQLQAKHLQDILKIKAEAVKNTQFESRSKEIERNLRDKIEQLEENLEEARNQIKKLKEDMKTKEREFANSILDYKRRQTIVMQERDKMMRRRPQEIMESSESESSSEEKEASPVKPKKTLKEVIKNNKKIGRNDLLNLPSSEDEKVVKKLENLHVASSSEHEKESDESEDKLAISSKNKVKSFLPKGKIRSKGLITKAQLHKRVRTNSFSYDRNEDDDDLKSAGGARKKKRKRRDASDGSGARDKTIDHPEEIKKKLEDAEYKDLKQRYNLDERDINYILNNQENISQARKAEEEGLHLHEDLDKIEEEQDRVFREKVALIAKDTLREMKLLDALSDLSQVENLQEKMIHQVFECFLENKQELLKKIADKLASQRDPDEYDDDGYDDIDQDSPSMKPRRRSDESVGSRKGFKSKRRLGSEGSNRSGESHEEGVDNEDGDYTANMIDRSSGYDEEDNGFVDNSDVGKPRRGKQHKRRKRDLVSKNSESQTTFMMNIQTTADLISYVKRRQKKRGPSDKRQARTSRHVVPIGQQTRTIKGGNVGGMTGIGGIGGIGGMGGMGHMRHYGIYQQMQRTVDVQTEDLDILDLRATEVNLTEVYHFDKISSCLRKIVIERGVDAEILRQFEYIHKDTIRSRFRSRQNLAGRYGKALSKQDQFKKNISDVVTKGEVNRLNDAIKALVNKVKDYEHEHAYLEEKRSCISAEFPLFKESENDVFNRGWRKGYSAGYSRGSSNGFFKGSIEAQYIGHQKGIEEGMQEGWNFGFDEGFKTGIRKVFRDAREAGIDLSSLELMEYISQEDKIKGLMKNLYTKLTKVFATSDRLEAANKLHEKFMNFSEKRKKLAVKVGKKNIVKMITQFFTAKINSNSYNQLLNEFLFDECIKKYGNSKMADKKLIQIFAGAVYHQKNERVNVF